MFSKILPGSYQNPDIWTIWRSEKKEGSSSEGLSSGSCLLNNLGYIPLVSTITGTGRALLGVIHTIKNLAVMIFSNKRREKFQEVIIGGKNIGRGIVEAIPIIGNVTCAIIDFFRVNRYHEMTHKEIDKNKVNYDNYTALFAYGKEMAKRPTAEVESELSKLNSTYLSDIVRIVRNEPAKASA